MELSESNPQGRANSEQPVLDRLQRSVTDVVNYLSTVGQGVLR